MGQCWNQQKSAPHPNVQVLAASLPVCLDALRRPVLGEDSMLRERVMQELSQHRHLFQQLDTDDDGRITWLEFSTVWRCLGPEAAPERIRALFDLLDTNGNGSVSLVEMVKGAKYTVK